MDRGSDNRYLDEVAEDHAQMIEDVFKTSYQLEFLDREQAYQTQMQMLSMALENLGVKLPTDKKGFKRIHPKVMEKRLKDKHVRITTMRADQDMGDYQMWINGAIGVYDTSHAHDELVYVISSVKRNNGSRFAIVPRAQKWAIRTNVEKTGRKIVNTPAMEKKSDG